VLFLSVSGHHHDIIRTARLARLRGCDARAVTSRSDSPLARSVTRDGSPDAAFVTPEPRYADGLIAVHGIVTFAVLAARMYAGSGPWAPCFEVDGAAMPTQVPGFVVALGAGAAEPAAVDFANKCQEAGLAPAWQTDVRHFSHGQWMTLHDAGTGVLLVAFATRSQRPYLERFAAVLPSSVPLLPIVVDTEGAPAALSLLARSMRSFEELAARGRGAPTLETIPAWGRGLYELEP
jgi:fructoselysine-6-P-deglycase FrlB-like protein